MEAGLQQDAYHALFWCTDFFIIFFPLLQMIGLKCSHRMRWKQEEDLKNTLLLLPHMHRRGNIEKESSVGWRFEVAEGLLQVLLETAGAAERSQWEKGYWEIRWRDVQESAATCLDKLRWVWRRIYRALFPVSQPMKWCAAEKSSLLTQMVAIWFPLAEALGLDLIVFCSLLAWV